MDLNSPGDAQTALTTIAAAIATVAAQRGAIGSGINQMNAAVNVMNNTSQNLTSSLSGIQDANIGQVVANMSKYPGPGADRHCRPGASELPGAGRTETPRLIAIGEFLTEGTNRVPSKIFFPGERP